MRTLALSLLMIVLGGCETGTEVPTALGTNLSRPLVVSLGMDNHPVQLGGASSTDPIRLHVEGNSSDPSYRTTWTLQPGACLHVVPRTGGPVVIQGSPIVADYYHLGRVLGVAIGAPGSSQQLLAYGDPVSWQTAACPAAAPVPAPPQ